MQVAHRRLFRVVMNRSFRRVAVVLVVVGSIVLLQRSWDDARQEPQAARTSSSGSAQRMATADGDRSAPSAGPALRAAEAPQIAARGTDTPQQVGGLPVRLQVLAPPDVPMGDAFDALIHVEANGGIRRLLFDVSYNKSLLRLVESSPGNFAAQGGLPARLGAEEPSDGNIQVVFDVDNGLAAAGAGNVADLRFESIKRGVSAIKLQNVAVIDTNGAPASNVAVLQEGVVAIQ